MKRTTKILPIICILVICGACTPSIPTPEPIVFPTPQIPEGYSTYDACAYLVSFPPPFSYQVDPENEDKAIETVLKYNQETPEEIVRKQLPATRVLMLPEPDFEFGKIDVVAWKQTEQIMLAQKLIAEPVHIESRLKPGVNK